jgi:3-isopropylmalate/(R)-2-methylmalate dehydratase small subunit
MILRGAVLGIDRVNIDTDQFISAKHLTGVSTRGLGAYLFENLRGGAELLAAHPDASILVAGDNVGCGSSREHAVWALKDRGFRAVIAPSFARIFLENCYANGIVPVHLEGEAHAACLRASELEIDVEREEVLAQGTLLARFALDPLRKQFLLRGGFMEYLAAKVPAVKAWVRERDLAG